MELRQTLIDISNDARGWLEAWTRDFNESQAKNSGDTKTNPIAWQLGHIASAEDDVYRLFTGESGVVPEEVRAVCATGCPPPTDATNYPPLPDLWGLLDRTHEQLLSLVEAADDADLDRSPLEESRFFRSLGQAIYEIALHENYHVGEIGALRKALGMKPIG
ncbi:MAG: DinB family protein [Gemmatimonadetes bacterium]|uniref:DinB family protein n=1 Tax=Candidatus Kutchimonas denitrificans TaxID=3056748 RepID=A0AAE4ZAF7_9BACT|nr:DinB family protein [Gemmatimonadota bacterium]NIR76674.1 DinB family protein [Candidatus Kutchimonas denitrificans]NIS02423.1 DinB family protein [Gemmatimonadota bacterium]NIT68327.1 DinB family protein [Gemmatimonadota bacterium]NIU54794.1 hypothetical protein [Gemmatimonadota bacterium]